jgi:DNA replication ATP-dependent helicase Dna2
MGKRMSNTAGLLSDLYQLVHDEQQTANHQLFTTWERPLSDKLQKGITQGFVRIERGPEPTTLWAYPDDTESRFREGDLLCLHQGNPLEPLCRGLSFELEEDNRWLLRGIRAVAAFNDYMGGTCYVDPDAMDLRSANLSFCRWPRATRRSSRRSPNSSSSPSGSTCPSRGR